MRRKLSAAAILFVVAAAVAAAATAGRATAPQRVAITSPHGNSALFVLTPLASGPILHDSGTATACCWSQRFVRRDGQSIEIDNPLRTFVGKHGTFVWRAQIQWVDLDSGYTIGTGTWKVVRGTGAYTNLQGHGRIGIVASANEQGVANRAEGILNLGR